MALAGKRCLIVGLANHRSIAWGIAQAWHKAGAQVLLSSLPRFQPSVQKLLTASWGGEDKHAHTRSLACDVTDQASIQTLFQQVGARYEGQLDVLLHAVAYASPQAMKQPFLETTAADFAQAHLISSHSLIALAKEALPLLTHKKEIQADLNIAAVSSLPSFPPPSTSSSILTLSYLGSNQAIPSYKVMGPAKASLEATVRLLAAELGPEHNIRVNAISPGPIHTLSSRGIPGFVDMYKEAEKLAPLRRNVTVEEVGEVATFLASEGARGMTGQVVYVDGGVSVVGGGRGGGGGSF